MSQVASGLDEYYTGVGEAPGVWIGSGVESLGLVGEVEPTDLRAVLAGLAPGTGLTPNGTTLRAHPRRVPGFDLTFSVPKSVSVAYALADRRVQHLIVTACEAALAETLGWLEREACFVRRGTNKSETATRGVRRGAHVGWWRAGLRRRRVSASDLLRVPGIPHLHWHVLVANLAQGIDGRWSALDGRADHRHRPDRRCGVPGGDAPRAPPLRSVSSGDHCTRTRPRSPASHTPCCASSHGGVNRSRSGSRLPARRALRLRRSRRRDPHPQADAARTSRRSRPTGRPGPRRQVGGRSSSSSSWPQQSQQRRGGRVRCRGRVVASRCPVGDDTAGRVRRVARLAARSPSHGPRRTFTRHDLTRAVTSALPASTSMEVVEATVQRALGSPAVVPLGDDSSQLMVGSPDCRVIADDRVRTYTSRSLLALEERLVERLALAASTPASACWHTDGSRPPSLRRRWATTKQRR